MQFSGAKVLKIIFSVSVFVLSACSSSNSPDTKLDQLLHDQITRYPAMRIEDVYKLLYQGTLGIEHLLTDTTAAKQYLADEWRAIMAREDEPLYEIISPDSQWVRLNLKPYKAAGGDIEKIWEAMLHSAHVTKSKESFIKRWQEFISLVNEKKLLFDVSSLNDFDKQNVLANYPAIHHSQEYTRAYQPAYRVLLLGEARRLERLISAKNPF